MAAIRPGTHAVFTLAIAATAALATLHLARLVDAFSWHTALPMALGFLIGILLADLISGLVHWGCDTWGGEETPWLGSTLIRSFREHHREPRAMLDHDFVEVTGDSAIPVALGFALITLPPSARWIEAHESIHALSWSLLCVAALANQLHKWAHTPSPPRWVRQLQRCGIILSRRRHAEHHRAPHLDGYCISSGWLNGALDRLNFWRALERVVRIATGYEPRTDSESRR